MAREAPQVSEPRSGALLEFLAVGAEVEEAIEGNAEQVERCSCRHSHSGHSDGEVHCVTGPL